MAVLEGSGKSPAEIATPVTCVKPPDPLPVGQQGGTRAALVLFYVLDGPVSDYVHIVVSLPAFPRATSAARCCSIPSGVTPPRACIAFCLQQSRNEMLGERAEGRAAIAYSSDKEEEDASTSLSEASLKEKKSKCVSLTVCEVTV